MSRIVSYPSPLTWDEFLALPHETRNAALIDGEVVVNPPDAQHELIVRNLNVVFTEWLRARAGRGEVSTQQPVKINHRRGYQPDFMWYPADRCSPDDQPLSFTGLPAIVVEVLSPSTRSFDLLRKRADYERIGLSEVWFLDQTPRVLVCQRPAPDAPYIDCELGPSDTVTSPLLDGFAVAVDDLFRR